MLGFYADASSPYHRGDFDPTRRTILYCASGGRSALGAGALATHGYGDMTHLDGGLESMACSGFSGRCAEGNVIMKIETAALAVAGSVALVAPPAAAAPPVGPGGHVDHLITGSAGCVTIDAVLFLREPRRLHQGATASGGERTQPRCLPLIDRSCSARGRRTAC